MVLTGGLVASGGLVVEVEFLPRCPIGVSRYETLGLSGNPTISIHLIHEFQY